MKKGLNLDLNNDFGFSFVDEDEMRALEKSLQEELKKKDEEVLLTAKEYKEKLEALKSIIMPFLKSLADQPSSKTYIYWPNRKERVESFMKKINEIVG